VLLGIGPMLRDRALAAVTMVEIETTFCDTFKEHVPRRWDMDFVRPCERGLKPFSSAMREPAECGGIGLGCSGWSATESDNFPTFRGVWTCGDGLEVLRLPES
jgi:hypothetical protein